MIYDILFFLAIVGVAALPFIRGLWKSELENCRYQLFSVRDDLVYHVANNDLDKDSEIFNYYYSHVNKALRVTEPLTLQSVIQFLSTDEVSKEDFDNHKKLLESFKVTLQDAPNELRESIKSYYEALRDMILINSNFFSVAYLLYRNHAKVAERISILGWAGRREPKVADAFATIKNDCDRVGLAACN